MREVKIGIFSDSHGDTRALDELLEQMGYINAACFLGDIARDAAHLECRLDAMANRPPLYAVRGNNDYASSLPDSLLCEIGGKRFYLTHGHMNAGMLGLAYAGQAHQADVVLFGHTHIPTFEYAEGILLLNPGSAGNYCRGGRARATMLIIRGEQMTMKDVFA